MSACVQDIEFDKGEDARTSPATKVAYFGVAGGCWLCTGAACGSVSHHRQTWW